MYVTSNQDVFDPTNKKGLLELEACNCHFIFEVFFTFESFNFLVMNFLLVAARNAFNHILF